MSAEVKGPSSPVSDAAAPGAQPSVSAPDASATPVAATEPKKEGDDLSARFAALSRQEKKIQEEKRRAKEMLDKYSPFDEAISQKDALKLLKNAGFSINDVLDAALRADQPPTTEDKLKSVEERLAKWEEQKKLEREEAEKSEQMKTASAEVQAFKQSLSAHLDANPEKFELIKALDASDNVYEACFEAIKSDPESYPTRAEAEALIPKVAELIEHELGERFKKASGVKKLKSLLGLTDAQATDPDALKDPKSVKSATLTQPALANSKQDVTLTNKNAMNPAQPEARPKAMSREESLKRAAAFLEAQLKAKEQGQKALQ